MSNREVVYERLAKEYAGAEQGTWVVKGEDSNPDLGGHHHNPVLGYFEGQYTNILDIAMELSGFFTWGGGGSIEKVVVNRIDHELQKEMTELAKQIKQVQDEKVAQERRAKDLRNHELSLKKRLAKLSVKAGSND